MGRKKHIEHLKEFKKEIGKRIKIQKMILFGSRASGKPRKESDFDIIIVSPNFKGKDSLVRGREFYKSWNINYPVDFLCYTPEEFKKLKKQLTIVQIATKEGKEIWNLYKS